jgi:stage IV sporulation protein FB
MRREGGFLVVGEWNGAPVRVHLLAPLFAFLMPGHPTTPGTVVGLLLVVLAHELGHALLIRAVGARVLRIDLLPWGGECTHTGTTSEFHESVIAWGGVLAQFAVMIPAQLTLAYQVPPTAFAADFLWALTFGSLILALFNLIPVPPLDGAKAWRLLILGPMWLLRRFPLSDRLNRWRRRRHLPVVEKPPPKNDYLN